MCLPADETTGLYEAEIMAYRRATKPPTFTSLPGKSLTTTLCEILNMYTGQEDSLKPGFEVICTVRAELTQCLIETPVRVSPTGARHRTADVSSLRRQPFVAYADIWVI